ncbi:hypothetical protein RJ40_11255 [Methanofollis aquaemaris]|uniref:Uncharacterized protein n=1 Tax=Methanofollis aquaemaris TaxID=126734 RepID=A0A8A3S841_9EURY|nr:hypothetical protein [Methanofollis aquaemaris]QSZ68029.1 hypothetical protein RJ40_11255 [Methanofollis aquaemaris]
MYIIDETTLDKKYLEQLFIEVQSEQSGLMKKVPDINCIEHGRLDSKYAVYWKDGDHHQIIKKFEKENDAMIFYKKTIHAIINAYNTRKRRDYISLYNIYILDIEDTLYSKVPEILI